MGFSAMVGKELLPTLIDNQEFGLLMKVEVDLVDVRPDYQSKGIGKLLLNKFHKINEIDSEASGVSYMQFAKITSKY